VPRPRDTKRLTYDADPGVTLAAGEALRTGTGRTYLVVSARRVRSRVAPNRWALKVVVVEAPSPDARIHMLVWNARTGRERSTR
jgi:hypothetical protein